MVGAVAVVEVVLVLLLLLLLLVVVVVVVVVCVVVLLGVLSMRRAAVIGKSIPDGTNQLAPRFSVIRTRELTVRSLPGRAAVLFLQRGGGELREAPGKTSDV